MKKSECFIDEIFNNILDNEKYAIITDRDEKITYDELFSKTTELSTHLKKNSVALLIMNNDVGSVIFYLASLMVGIVPIILDKQISKLEINQYIKEYSPEYLVLVSSNENIITCNEWEYVKKENIYRHMLYECKNSTTKKELAPSLAMLLPTSGTAYASKLVRISHENIYDNTKNICYALQIHEDDIAITSLPLSYTFGLSVLNTHLMMHATILLTDKSVLQKSFWLYSNKYKATSFSGVPYTYELLEKNGHIRKENTIQVYTQAGGRLSLHLQRLFGEYCLENRKKFYVMYGQTEATARISVLQPEKIIEKIGSVGQVIRGGCIQIEKESMLQKDGQIVYTGKNVCMGYCTCVEDLKSEDENNGLLYTGDIGFVDDDGFLYITGRNSGFIKMYGRRISLSSIESLLDEQYNINAIVSYREPIIIIAFEKKQLKKIEVAKMELLKQLHLSKSDISFQMVEQFERTYNGKLKRGRKNEEYI